MGMQASHTIRQTRLAGWSAWLLALIWVAIALPKAAALPELAAVVDASMLLPSRLAAPGAVAVVAWDAGLALALIVPISRRPALWATAVTLLAYLGFALWRALAGIEAPCRCFGALLRSSPGTSAAVCLVLLIPTALGLSAHDDITKKGDPHA